MTIEETYQYLLKTIHDCMPDLDVSGLNRDTRFVDTNIDSMAFMLILSKIEGNTGVHVPETEWPGIQTVGEAAEALARHMEP